MITSSYAQHMNSTPNTICFNIPSGTEYCGALLDFKKVNNQIHAVIEVDPPTWEYIDLLQFFNLRWDARNPGTISGTKRVQLEIVLDPKIYDALTDAGTLLVSKDAFLTSDTNHPMRSVLSWFALEVTEEVDLPEHLKSMGTVREGFTTTWKDKFR